MNTMQLTGVNPAFSGLLKGWIKKKDTAVAAGAPKTDGTKPIKAPPSLGYLGYGLESALKYRLADVKVALKGAKVVTPPTINELTTIGLVSDPRESGALFKVELDKDGTKAEQQVRIVAGKLIPMGYYNGYQQGFNKYDKTKHSLTLDRMEMIIPAGVLAQDLVLPTGRAPKLLRLSFNMDRECNLYEVKIDGANTSVIPGKPIGTEKTYVLPTAWYELPVVVPMTQKMDEPEPDSAAPPKAKKPGLHSAKNLEAIARAYAKWFGDNIDKPQKVGVETWPRPSIYSMDTHGNVKSAEPTNAV